jgi:hypothetical protein
MEYNPGIFPFFGLQNYKSCSNKKNYEQKSNNPPPFRRLPPFIRSLPEISGGGAVSGGIFDAKINSTDMKERHHNPFAGIARFLISLGLLMIAAKTDLLSLGEISEYYRWEMLLIFFGVWSLLSLELVSAVVLFALGFWFLMPDMTVQLSPLYRQIFWPAVLVLAGVAFMIRPITKRKK